MPPRSATRDRVTLFLASSLLLSGAGPCSPKECRENPSLPQCQAANIMVPPMGAPPTQPSPPPAPAPPAPPGTPQASQKPVEPAPPPATPADQAAASPGAPQPGQEKTTYQLSPETYRATGEIRIAQTTANVWGQPLDIEVPPNRPTWAIALAHGHQILRNVLGTEKFSVNYLYAAALKESRAGCDPEIQASPNRQYPMGFQPSSIRDGCYQLEPTMVYSELTTLYPNRWPSGAHQTLIAGTGFEASALARAYYDIFAVRLIDTRPWGGAGAFFEQAKDPQAAVKGIAGAYNRGLWSNVANIVFNQKRAECLAAPDLLSCFGAGSLAIENARSVAEITTALDNAQSFYDGEITWATVNLYLDKILPLYPEAKQAEVRFKVKQAFDQAAGGGLTISFRAQFGPVLDVLMLELPVDDPSAAVRLRYPQPAP